jgi:L-methionine (R)-S-oxide reductase
MEPDQALNEAHAALSDEALADDAALNRVVEVLFASHPTWSWVGVYLVVGDTLVLGPYAGAPTEHTRIPVGTGVCGAALEQGRNMVIGDVKGLDNYLACSPSTQSEMVLLIRDDGDIVGEFDVDSDDIDAFGAPDLDALRPLADLAGPRCRRLAATAG